METTELSPPWGDEHSFRMIQVGHKESTARRAIAQGRILLSTAAYRAIRERTNPKGDVLAMAEVAGIMAAKRTADLLPLCHPLPIHQVKVGFSFDDAAAAVTAFCEVSTIAKTGVEMEALTGVNGALLAIYDLSKAVDPVLRISDIRLNVKEGGKSGRWVHPDHAAADAAGPGCASDAAKAASGAGRAPERERALAGIRAAVLTISDRCSRGEATDRSGPAAVEQLRNEGAEVAHSAILPDDVDAIASAVRELCAGRGAPGAVDLVVTTGGTGVGPRDLTPEALAPLYTRRVPGFGELARASGAAHTPMSWLSRSEGGFVGRTLVLALPGSVGGVTQGLEALRDLIPHAVRISRGGSHEAGGSA